MNKKLADAVAAHVRRHQMLHGGDHRAPARHRRSACGTRKNRNAAVNEDDRMPAANSGTAMTKAMRRRPRIGCAVLWCRSRSPIIPPSKHARHAAEQQDRAVEMDTSCSSRWKLRFSRERQPEARGRTPASSWPRRRRRSSQKLGLRARMANTAPLTGVGRGDASGSAYRFAHHAGGRAARSPRPANPTTTNAARQSTVVGDIAAEQHARRAIPAGCRANRPQAPAPGSRAGR